MENEAEEGERTRRKKSRRGGGQKNVRSLRVRSVEKGSVTKTLL